MEDKVYLVMRHDEGSSVVVMSVHRTERGAEKEMESLEKDPYYSHESFYTTDRELKD